MTNSVETLTYICEHVMYEKRVWNRLSFFHLCDVVTGGEVLEETVVQACWDSNSLYVRFECVDTYSMSRFLERNDPLFEQDVVEIFIDEEGEGKRYIEIVVSPNNVVFDAMITHPNPDDPLEYQINRQWETRNFSSVVEVIGNKRIYVLQIPLSNFIHQPFDGMQWKVNLFRIDEEKNGERHYQAWSPTGMVNYHIPDRFGTLVFVKSK